MAGTVLQKKSARLSMKQQLSKWSRLSLAVGFLVFGGCTPLTASVTSDDKRLFTDVVTSEGMIDERMRPMTIRYRFVSVNFQLLAATTDSNRQSTQAGNTLQLNFFNDAIFTGVFDRREVQSDRGFAWFGHIEGVENSQVTFVVRDGVTAGNISVQQTFYQIRYAGNGIHVIYQIDPKVFPPESRPVVP